MGTAKAKNYSSDVHVYDEAGNLVRQQRISMNDPLRYNGETFYQSSFDKTEKTTILQVVKNPGWLLPYISVIVVGLGLVLHFGIYLIQFLLRGAPTNAAKVVAPAPGAVPDPSGPDGVVAPRSAAVRFFPWIVLGIAARCTCFPWWGAWGA